MISLIDGGFPIPLKTFRPLLSRIAREIDLPGTIAVKFSSLAESREMNRRYRRVDRATDVLAFPVREKFPEGQYAGDILICYPIALKQARENRQSVECELLLLMIHGLLHLRGFDHEKDNGIMCQRQNEIFVRYKNELDPGLKKLSGEQE